MMYASVLKSYYLPDIQTAYLQQAELTEALQDFVPLLDTVEAQRIALYTQTLSGGGDSSIAFWQEALDKEPRFANPRIFPWALPSSLSGYLAMQIGIKGPNYTFVGGISAFLDALDQALFDLSDGIIDRAILVSATTPLEASTGLFLSVLSQASFSTSPLSSQPQDILDISSVKDLSAFVTELFIRHQKQGTHISIQDQFGLRASLRIKDQWLSFNRSYAELT